CVPGRNKTSWHWEPGECTFDPCTCKTCSKPGRLVRCTQPCPAETRCKKVWKEETVCETVPVTRCVKECVHDRVPYTVCKKVPHTCVKKVPYTVTKMVPETVVEKVPYKVTRMVSERVPYTVQKTVRGCWVDNAGGHHGAAGANADGTPWTFQEGCSYERTWTTTSTRMVSETQTKQVPVTTWRTVSETCVKTVPYTVTKMVPQTITKTVPVTHVEMVQETCTKRVPYTVTRMESHTVTKQVPYTVTKQVPVTTTVRVPYTVTEQVPYTVSKRVPVQVEKDVWVVKARRVPVEVCEEAPACGGGGGLLGRLFHGRFM